LAAGLALPAEAQQIPVRRGAQPGRNLLTVSADAQVKAAPDQALVRLGVEAEAPTAARASDAEATAMAAVIAAIKQTGVASNDIQTTGLSLEPQYTNGTPNAPPKIRGFNASNTVQVTVNDISRVGAVVDAGLGAGANRLDGVDFTLKDDTSFRTEALKKAAHTAALKAQALADALGVHLGPLASVIEGGAGGPPPPLPMRAMASYAGAATPVEPGRLNVGASVTLQYHIIQ